MNLPNKLTLGRLVLTVLFVAALAVPFPGRFTVGLVVFIAASVTDYLDGSIARRRGLVTTFGKLMDPLVDKVLTVSAFVMLADHGMIPAWAVVIILTREFLVTGLRLVATSQGAVLAADSLGKQKTILQIAAAIYFLIVLAAAEPPLSFLSPVLAWAPFRPAIFGVLILALMLVSTVVSGLSYLAKNRVLLRDA